MLLNSNGKFNYKFICPNFKWKISISNEILLNPIRKSQFQIKIFRLRWESFNSNWIFSNFKEILRILSRKSEIQVKFCQITWKNSQFQITFCIFQRENLNFKCNFPTFNEIVSFSTKVLPILSKKSNFKMKFSQLLLEMV